MSISGDSVKKELKDSGDDQSGRSKNSRHAQHIDIIRSLRKSLNDEVELMTDGRMQVFSEVTILVPDTNYLNHGFYTTISWLYAHYFECGRKTIPFLEERARTLGVDTQKHLAKHKNLVQNFRTMLQHNMDIADKEDAAKLANCNYWMGRQIGARASSVSCWPCSDGDWGKMLEALLVDAVEYFTICLNTVKAISQDQYAVDVIARWEHRVNRFLAPFEWDFIIERAVFDMGLHSFRVKRFREVNLVKWNADLSIWSGETNSENCARAIVEESLVNSKNMPLPITGKDIIEEFDVEPGPIVGKIYGKALEMFRSGVCGREELIAKLKSVVPDLLKSGK